MFCICQSAPDSILYSLTRSQIKVVDGPFFKPLLHLPKAQLVQYLQQRGLEWSEDSSNQERAYQRNKVRLDLMPLLGDLAGSPEALSARLTSLSRQSADLKEWIDSEVLRRLPYYSRSINLVA